MKKFKQVAGFCIIFCCLFWNSCADNSKHLDEVNCNDTGCTSDAHDCKNVCGCDGIYKIDDATGDCTIDYDYLKQRTRSTNEMHTGEESELYNDEGLAKNIRERNDHIFQGIIYCAFFFVTCASICVLSACIFCCRIHYSDQKLKNEVKALANSMNVEYHKKRSLRKKPRDQKGESCNVIVEDANIMCV